MAEIQNDATQRQLSRAFDLDGPQLTSVSTDVVPVIVVGPDAPAGYGTTRRFSRASSVTGDATHTGWATIINPSPASNTSDELLVLDRIGVGFTGGAQEFNYGLIFGLVNPIEATVVSGIGRGDFDYRGVNTQLGGVLPVDPGRVGVQVNVNGPLGGATVSLGRMVGVQHSVGYTELPLHGVVLTPNSGLMIWPTAVALTMYFYFEGRILPMSLK